MRVASAQISLYSIDRMVNQHREMREAQGKLSTGLRVEKPSDDPSAMGRVLELQHEVDRAEQFRDNMQAAENKLSLTDGILGDITDTIQRVRELTVYANNSIHSPATLKTIAVEVEQHLEQLTEQANFADANGEYLFSGSQGFSKPVVNDGQGNFSYAGDDSNRLLQVGKSFRLAVSEPGSKLFFDLPAQVDGSETQTAKVNDFNYDQSTLQTTDTIVDSSMLNYTGSTGNTNTEFTQFTVSDLPTNGTVARDGVTLGDNDTFTLQDVNAGLITYTNSNTDLTKQVDEQLQFAVKETQKTITTTDLPAYNDNGGSSSLVYTVSELPTNGTLSLKQYDNSGNPIDPVELKVGDTFTIAQITAEDLVYKKLNTNTSDSFKFDVTDTNYAGFSDTGKEVTVNSIDTTGDLDFTTGLDITLDTVPIHGKLVNDGVELKVGDTFLMSDVESGKVQYINNNQSAITQSSETISFTLSNGSSQINGSTPLSMSGDITFANGPQEGKQSLFHSIQDTIDKLKEGTQTSDRDLGNISNALDNVIDVHAGLGARMSSLEQEKRASETVTTEMQKTMSDARDLDYAEAIAVFNQQMLALKAAQQSYAKIQGLSLFQYL